MALGYTQGLADQQRWHFCMWAWNRNFESMWGSVAVNAGVWQKS